jgi:magnesium transporter
MEQLIVQNLILAMLESGVYNTELEELHYTTIAEALRDLEREQIEAALALFPSALSGEIFALLEPGTQEDVAEHLTSDALAEILAEMPSDDRADLAKRLPDEVMDAALLHLDEEERQDIEELTAYADGTIGSIMTTAYVAVPHTVSVEGAMSLIRQEASEAETIYVNFVVDQGGKLLGTLSLKRLILSDPKSSVRDVMNTDVITVEDHADRELAGELIARYDMLALAVTDAQGVLRGIVTHDDILDVINQEHTEDMEKFMGITGAHEDNAYLRTPIFTHFKNRIGWVLGLAVLGFFTGAVLKGFEGILQQLLLLALFMPMLADTGGNIGSQSATVIIRALAMHQISFKDFFRVIGREIRVSLCTAVVLATVAFGRVMFLAGDAELPTNISIFAIGATISIALAMQVVSSAIVGSMLPLLAVRFKLDPAVVASPAITTFVDITGILIYFNLARMILGL